MWSCAVIHTQHLQILLFFFLLMRYNLSSAICPYLSTKYCIICIHPFSDSFILAWLSFLLSCIVICSCVPTSVSKPSRFSRRHRLPAQTLAICSLPFASLSYVCFFPNILLPSAVPFLILIFYLLSWEYRLWLLNNTQRAVVSFYFVNSWLWRWN